jgi:hypothetical protein
MGEARSEGRPWRPYPAQDVLTRQARELAIRLGLAATGGITAAAAAALMLAALPAAAVLAPVPGAGGDSPAYALVAVARLQTWLGGQGTGGLVWAVVALVAVASLLTTGNGVPHAHPRMREFLRAPTANTGAILGMLAPGQVGYAVPGVIGTVLPRRVDRLLVR